MSYASFGEEVPVAPAPSALSQIRPYAAAVGGVAGAFHGYRRNKSIFWAVAWSVFGGLMPFLSLPISLAQGFGKPRATANKKRRRGLAGLRAAKKATLGAVFGERRTPRSLLTKRLIQAHAKATAARRRRVDKKIAAQFAASDARDRKFWASLRAGNLKR